MLTWSRRHRPLGWIAACAILLAAFAPWVSQALAGSMPRTPGGWPAWQVICGAAGLPVAGVKATATAPDGRSLPTGGDHAGAHCPFCLPHAGALGLPPAPLPALAMLAPVRDGLPALFLQAPAAPHVWRSSLPRAPPATA